jgi:hypothetical protein
LTRRWGALAWLPACGLQEAQDSWNAQRSLPGWMNESEFLWITQKQKVGAPVP